MTLSCNRPNGIMKPLSLRKSKYSINTCSFRLHNNFGSTHPSMTASKGSKLPPSFSGFKSQKFLRESSYDGVSGTGNDEHSTVVKQLSKCLLSLVARSVPPPHHLVNASGKRRALTIKHLLLLIIVNRVVFNRLVII